MLTSGLSRCSCPIPMMFGYITWVLENLYLSGYQVVREENWNGRISVGWLISKHLMLICWFCIAVIICVLIFISCKSFFGFKWSGFSSLVCLKYTSQYCRHSQANPVDSRFWDAWSQSHSWCNSRRTLRVCYRWLLAWFNNFFYNTVTV